MCSQNRSSDLPVFRDRMEAGKLLAAELARYADREDVYVFALPRGGVPVAYEIARDLDAPLDIIAVRKLGVPDQPELAMGAIASGGIQVLNHEIIRLMGISETTVEKVAARALERLGQLERLYRERRSPLDPRGRTVILVDDGLATGSAMRAAATAMRRKQCARIIAAVPIAPREACESLKVQVDEIVCARTPEPFEAVGAWYQHFPQITDQEVKELLFRAQDFRRVSAFPLLH